MKKKKKAIRVCKTFTNLLKKFGRALAFSPRCPSRKKERNILYSDMLTSGFGLKKKKDSKARYRWPPLRHVCLQPNGPGGRCCVQQNLEGEAICKAFDPKFALGHVCSSNLWDGDPHIVPGVALKNEGL